MPRPTRESQAVDHIDDIFGGAWWVREYRAAVHGWDVAIGWPDAPGSGGARTILTAALAEYLVATDRLRDIALPIAVTTVKKLRSQLGLRFDWDGWWSARAGDLATMTLADFCTKHRCSMGAASQRRAQLCREMIE